MALFPGVAGRKHVARTQTALGSFLSYNLHFLFLSAIKVVGKMLIRRLVGRLWVGVLCFCSHLNLSTAGSSPELGASDPGVHQCSNQQTSVRGEPSFALCW